MSNEGSNPSNGIQHKMEDEQQENRNYESTDFVCSDTDAASESVIEAYFGEPDEPIVYEAWQEIKAKGKSVKTITKE